MDFFLDTDASHYFTSLCCFMTHKGRKLDDHCVDLNALRQNVTYTSHTQGRNDLNSR